MSARNAGGPAQEQRSHTRLQPAHRLGGSRDGHAEPLCGGAEAALFHHGKEHVQTVEWVLLAHAHDYEAWLHGLQCGRGVFLHPHSAKLRCMTDMPGRCDTLLPTDIEHLTLSVREAKLHVARCGQGRPLVLLHGWPEFWLTWEPVMRRLADRFQLIVPDLRGFGDSDKPTGPFGPQDQARDILAVIDALGLDRVGLVGHDIGGAVMQGLARLAPERLTGVFFFDFVYPGIGARMGAPDRLLDTWYMTFHATDLAPALLGSSPEAVRIYITHFLRHWTYRKDAFDGVLDQFVAKFQQPGNLAGGFAHYRAAFAGRIATMKGKAPALPPILLPTCVRWAEHDPMFAYAWTDRLTETFPDLDLALFPGVGHFPHREDPDHAAVEIAGFFRNC